MDVQGTEMIEKLRRSFRKGQETAPLFLEYFYKLHTRVVLYLSYAVVVKRFVDHSSQTGGQK